jgi:hypothetical protein
MSPESRRAGSRWEQKRGGWEEEASPFGGGGGHVSEARLHRCSSEEASRATPHTASRFKNVGSTQAMVQEKKNVFFLLLHKKWLNGEDNIMH